MRLSHRLATATAAVLLTGVLAGCSMSPDDSGASSGDASGGEQAASPTGEAVKGGEPGAGIGGEPVAKGTFDSPIAPGAKVDIAIMGLTVRGKLATLTTQFTPHLPAGVEDSPNPYSLNGDKGLYTSLIDPVNLKRYVVVEDSSGAKMESDDVSTQIANNQTANLTFTFAAPPGNVKAVDVQIGSWPIFRSIPVER